MGGWGDRPHNAAHSRLAPQPLSLSPRPWSWLGPNLYARPPGGPERPWSPPAPPSRFFSGLPPLNPLDSRKTGRKLQLLTVECRPSVGTEVAATFGAPGGIPARRLRHRAARAAPPPPAAGISSRFRALPPRLSRAAPRWLSVQDPATPWPIARCISCLGSTFKCTRGGKGVLEPPKKWGGGGACIRTAKRRNTPALWSPSPPDPSCRGRTVRCAKSRPFRNCSLRWARGPQYLLWSHTQGYSDSDPPSAPRPSNTWRCFRQCPHRGFRRCIVNESHCALCCAVFIVPSPPVSTPPVHTPPPGEEPSLGP